MSKLNFLGICGSLRHASRNMGLLRKAAQIMPPDSSLEIACISDIPFYNEDIAKPDSVKRLIKKAEKADGFLFAPSPSCIVQDPLYPQIWLFQMSRSSHISAFVV